MIEFSSKIRLKATMTADLAVSGKICQAAVALVTFEAEDISYTDMAGVVRNEASSSGDSARENVDDTTKRAGWLLC